MKDYNHSMTLAKKLNNWDSAEQLVNEVTHLAGLQDAESEQAAKDQGKRIAQKTNQHPGKTI